MDGRALNHNMSYICDRVWLGSARDAMNEEALNALTITNIVNATVEVDNYFPTTFIYHRVPLYDQPTERVTQFFKDIFEFIDGAHSDEGKAVLIHCQEGISRSVTLALAYRMVKEGVPLGKAFREMKLIRPEVEPNRGFLRELRELEYELLGKVTEEKLTLMDWGPLLEAPTRAERLKRCISDFIVLREDEHRIPAREAVRTAAREVEELNRDIPVIICEVFENFGGNSRRDKDARKGFAVALTDILEIQSHLAGELISAACIDSVPHCETWKELCLDIPLAPRFLKLLRDYIAQGGKGK
jgi:protein-tyrosine phosphatase